jgi:hypothetical protein
MVLTWVDVLIEACTSAVWLLLLAFRLARVHE